MANLLTRALASFFAAQPIPSAAPLDDEFNQLVGAAGVLNGNTTGIKLLIKTSDATDPPVDCDQVGAGLLARWKQNGSLKASLANNGDLTANGITSSSGVVTFGSIPLGPASDPTTDNQLARRAYVLGRKTAFYLGAQVPDPTVAAVSPVGLSVPVYVCPDGISITITKTKVCFMTGSHTSGGTLTFSWQKRTAASNWVTTSIMATATLSNTNNTQFVVYENDISDAPLLPGDSIELFITTRSGTVSERDVTAALVGTQQVF